MSAFERSARLALHAYPDAMRRERGPEILDTLLELQDAGSLRQVTELGALLTCGLRARRDLTVAGGRAHVWRTTASWIASWLAPILATALVLFATAYVLDVYVWCREPQCFDHEPRFRLAGSAAIAVTALATLLAAPVWRHVSVALSVVLLVELVAWHYRVYAGAGLVLAVTLLTATPLARRHLARHTLIVVAATVSGVLVPPVGVLVVAVLPLALLVALMASSVDPRAAIAGLALTVSLTPLLSMAGALASDRTCGRPCSLRAR
jgi:hypothetical protein